jgi:hypothetical protein
MQEILRPCKLSIFFNRARMLENGGKNFLNFSLKIEEILLLKQL